MARPKTDDARNDGFRVRLNKEERKMLDYIRDNNGCSYSELFRMWVRTEYIKAKSKEPDW